MILKVLHVNEYYTVQLVSLKIYMILNSPRKCHNLRLYGMSWHLLYKPRFQISISSYVVSTIDTFWWTPSQTFSPRYAKFSPFIARFVTLSPTCNCIPHIIHNYATLCNIICQLNYGQLSPQKWLFTTIRRRICGDISPRIIQCCKMLYGFIIYCCIIVYNMRR